MDDLGSDAQRVPVTLETTIKLSVEGWGFRRLNNNNKSNVHKLTERLSRRMKKVFLLVYSGRVTPDRTGRHIFERVRKRRRLTHFDDTRVKRTVRLPHLLLTKPFRCLSSI